MGTHFLKNYFTVFDQANSKIGFAKRLNEVEVERKSQFIKYVIGFMIGAILSIGGALGYRWYQKRQLR
jgi:hypothetical protein